MDRIIKCPHNFKEFKLCSDCNDIKCKVCVTKCYSCKEFICMIHENFCNCSHRQLCNKCFEQNRCKECQTQICLCKNKNKEKYCENCLINCPHCNNNIIKSNENICSSCNKRVCEECLNIECNDKCVNICEKGNEKGNYFPDLYKVEYLDDLTVPPKVRLINICEDCNYHNGCKNCDNKNAKIIGGDYCLNCIKPCRCGSLLRGINSIKSCNICNADGCERCMDNKMCNYYCKGIHNSLIEECQSCKKQEYIYKHCYNFKHKVCDSCYYLCKICNVNCKENGNLSNSKCKFQISVNQNDKDLHQYINNLKHDNDYYYCNEYSTNNSKYCKLHNEFLNF